MVIRCVEGGCPAGVWAKVGVAGTVGPSQGQTGPRHGRTMFRSQAGKVSPRQAWWWQNGAGITNPIKKARQTGHKVG